MDIVVDFVVVVFVVVCYDDVILTAFQSFMEENSFLCYLPIFFSILFFVFVFQLLINIETCHYLLDHS